MAKRRSATENVLNAGDKGLYLCGYREVNRELGSRATASQEGNIRELIPYRVEEGK